jgi:hypothetical protein
VGIEGTPKIRLMTLHYNSVTTKMVAVEIHFA